MHLRIEIPKPVPSPEDPKLHANRNMFRPKSGPISIFLMFSLIIALILYLVTLKGCPSHIMMECVPLIVPLIPLGLLLVWLSSLLIAISIKMVFRGLVHRIYLLVILVELIIIWTFSYGTTFQTHGAFNKAIFLLLLILNAFSLTFMEFLYKIYRSRPRLTLFFGSLILIVLILQMKQLYARGSCEKWDKGLKDTVMDNNFAKGGCEIPIPEFCFHELTSDWFDVSKLLKKNECSAFSEDIKLGTGDLLAFPKTQYFHPEEKYVENYQKHVLKLVQPITEDEINNGLYEIYLNQSQPDQQTSLNINIQKNQSLVERSKDILNNKGRLNFPNILNIYLDSVSRQHFSRKLPKTYHFIENRYRSENTQHESFQFFKYHASGTHTLPNQMRVFYGADYRKASEAESLLKTIKREGYITAKSSNLCSATYFDVSQTDKTLSNMDIEPFDHENIAFACDPNYRLMGGDGPYSYMTGSAAMLRRCLYGRDVHQYVLEYGEKFWNTYSEEPKFLELDLMDGHEPSAEVLKFLDDPLEKFLSRLEEQGSLKDTTIIFYADHGHHLNFFYYLLGLKDLYYELNLPMLFILFPKDQAKIHGQYMRNLENVLVSGFDIYNFYKAITGGTERVKFGIEFFDEEVDLGRNWRDLDLEEHLAICKR